MKSQNRVRISHHPTRVRRLDLHWSISFLLIEYIKDFAQVLRHIISWPTCVVRLYNTSTNKIDRKEPTNSSVHGPITDNYHRLISQFCGRTNHQKAVKSEYKITHEISVLCKYLVSIIHHTSSIIHYTKLRKKQKQEQEQTTKNVSVDSRDDVTKADIDTIRSDCHWFKRQWSPTHHQIQYGIKISFSWSSPQTGICISVGNISWNGSWY